MSKEWKPECLDKHCMELSFIDCIVAAPGRHVLSSSCGSWVEPSWEARSWRVEAAHPRVELRGQGVGVAARRGARGVARLVVDTCYSR